jgi:hypothetical protein
VFVRDSKVNLRQHAHRESGPFFATKKNGSIPKSLNRRGMYSHKKTNARLFLISSMVLFRDPNERVLVLLKTGTIVFRTSLDGAISTSLRD